MDARHKKNREERIYKMYVTDGLKILCGFDLRYADIMEDRPVDNRSAEEVIDGVKTHLAKLGEE